MAKMTKAQIEKRQLEIMNALSDMDEKTNVREAKIRTLTSEEQKEEREKLMAEQREQDRQYDKLVRESAGLSTRIKDMATREEAKKKAEEEEAAKREAEAKAKEEREARELEEQEQRFREQQAMRLRAQHRRREIDIESLNY